MRTKKRYYFSLNVVGDSNDENNFRHESLLINKQVSILKNSVVQNRTIRRIFRYSFSTITKNWIAFTRNVLKQLAKIVLIPLGLTAAASETNVAIHKKMFESGVTTSIILNEEMNIMRIVQTFKESGLSIQGVSQTIKYKAKEQKGGFIGILLGTLVASYLGDLLTGSNNSRTRYN